MLRIKLKMLLNPKLNINKQPLYELWQRLQLRPLLLFLESQLLNEVQIQFPHMGKSNIINLSI